VHSLSGLIFGEGERNARATVICLIFTAQSAWMWQSPFWENFLLPQVFYMRRDVQLLDIDVSIDIISG
jgi:hypothetical protein